MTISHNSRRLTLARAISELVRAGPAEVFERVLAVLQEGLGSVEHTAFVERLAAAGR